MSARCGWRPCVECEPAPFITGLVADAPILDAQNYAILRVFAEQHNGPFADCERAAKRIAAEFGGAVDFVEFYDDEYAWATVPVEQPRHARYQTRFVQTHDADTVAKSAELAASLNEQDV